MKKHFTYLQTQSCLNRDRILGARTLIMKMIYMFHKLHDGANKNMFGVILNNINGKE